MLLKGDDDKEANSLEWVHWDVCREQRYNWMNWKIKISGMNRMHTKILKKCAVFGLSWLLEIYNKAMKVRECTGRLEESKSVEFDGKGIWSNNYSLNEWIQMSW